jgi:hypothetical protein
MLLRIILNNLPPSNRFFPPHPYLVEESDNRLGVSPVFTLRTLRREHDEWKRLVPVDNGRQTKARFSQLLDILSSTRSAMEIDNQRPFLSSGVLIRFGSEEQISHLHMGRNGSDEFCGVLLCLQPIGISQQK